MQGNSLLEEYEGIKLFDEKILQKDKDVISDRKFDIHDKINSLQKEFIELHKTHKLSKIKEKQITDEIKRLEKEKKSLLKGDKIEDNLFTGENQARIKAEKLKDYHRKFFDATTRDEKKKYRGHIEELEWDLIETTLKEEGNLSSLKKLAEVKKSKIKPFFLWKLEFTEVFDEKNGFDIVIANPPYVSNKDMHRLGQKNQINAFNKIYLAAKSGNYDLHIIFIEKGLNLISNTGNLSFIVPNKFIIAKYSQELLKIIYTKYNFLSINDFSYSNAFENASIYPIVIYINKSHMNNSVTKINYMQYYPKVKLLHSIDWDYVNHSPITKENSLSNTILKKMESVKILNKSLKFSPGINGFQFTNYGRCVTEGNVTKKGKRLVVTGSIDKYTLLNKPTRYKGQLYDKPFIHFNSEIISEEKWKLFSTHKIIVAGMTKTIEATLDEFGEYAPAVSVYSIISDIPTLKYVLGILNSKFIDWYFKLRFEDKHLAGGYISINNQLLKQIPIIDTNYKIEYFIDLVSKILENKSISLNLEKENIINKIDIIVYKLYNLNYDEVKNVDPEIDKIISKEKYEKFKIE